MSSHGKSQRFGCCPRCCDPAEHVRCFDPECPTAARVSDDEIDGSGYARRKPGQEYPTMRDGEIVGGAHDGAPLRIVGPVEATLHVHDPQHGGE